MIDYSENRVFSLMVWQSRNEVHCNLLKGHSSFGSSNTVEGRLCFMGLDFVLLAYGTAFHIVRYPLVHSLPLMPFPCLSDRFISSWVSGRRVVMR